MSASASPVPQVRLVVAGLGRIAEVQREALADQAEFLWVGACDPDPSRADLCPHGAPCFSSLKECLAATPCDAVLVSTPTDTHFGVASAVLAAGRHLLLEKPAAAGLGEVEELHRLALAAGRQFQTAFHMSRGAEVDWLAAHLAEIQENGLAVPITGFECRFHDPLLIAGSLHPRAPSVLGSWVDSGINALSVLARFIPMEALQVAESVIHHVSNLPVRDVQAQVTLSDGNRSGTILTDWTHDTCAKTTLLHLADGRSWRLDHNAQTATLEPGGEARHCARHPDRMVDHYRGVFADFAAALATGKSNVARSLTLHSLLIEAEMRAVRTKSGSR